jgi:hypothetical protein
MFYSVRHLSLPSRVPLTSIVRLDAILNPAAALQSTAEDWLESFNNSPGTSLAELIMCILRACGCNASIDQDEVMDVDGVVEFLSELVEEFKKVGVGLWIRA